MPILVGLWLARLPPGLGGALLAIVIAINLYGHLASDPGVRRDWTREAAALHRAGIRHAVAEYWIAAPLTYYSGESLVVADAEGEWYPLRERPTTPGRRSSPDGRTR